VPNLLALQTESFDWLIGNDIVGRHLMDHPIQLSWALTREPVFPYRGPLSTSGIETLRDGSFRSRRAADRRRFEMAIDSVQALDLDGIVRGCAG